ncbi:hypothetical protein OY671_013093 [Metschnikowia pulcherrima]|nr:hypothetical protein OY671_013093 [Metschnikowia pulcherrima]
MRAIRVTVEDAARRALFQLEPWTSKRIRAVELSMNAGFQIIEEPVIAGPGADGSLCIAGESFLAGGISIDSTFDQSSDAEVVDSSSRAGDSPLDSDDDLDGPASDRFGFKK